METWQVTYTVTVSEVAFSTVKWKLHGSIETGFAFARLEKESDVAIDTADLIGIEYLCIFLAEGLSRNPWGWADLQVRVTKPDNNVFPASFVLILILSFDHHWARVSESGLGACSSPYVSNFISTFFYFVAQSVSKNLIVHLKCSGFLQPCSLLEFVQHNLTIVVEQLHSNMYKYFFNVVPF